MDKTDISIRRSSGRLEVTPAMALAASGFLAVWQGEQEEGLAQIEESMTIAQRLQDEQMMPLLLMINAIAYISMGRDQPRSLCCGTPWNCSSNKICPTSTS